MFMPIIKEEPLDEIKDSVLPTSFEDEIIASYDIVTVNNLKYKTIAISGLSKIFNRTKHYDVSIRTDLKEMKISSKLNDIVSICYTKETSMNLDNKSFVIKFSRETGSAYFIPVNSFHSISFVDESNKSNKAVDSQNMIFEDCFKMPHPSRNKHDQLCVEMKNYLYKPLKCIINTEQIKKFLLELYTTAPKRLSYSIENKVSADAETSVSEMTDLSNCPHWYLKMVNLYDIQKIDIAEIKVEIFLRKAQVLRFSEINEILNVDISKLICTLQSIGHLIKGNWVIKSNLLYKYNALHDSESKQNHYKDLISAREYILFLIATNRFVKFEQIYKKFKKTPDHEEILNRLTIRRGLNESVTFIMADDHKFLSEYSTLCHKQNQKTISLLSKYQNYNDT